MGLRSLNNTNSSFEDPYANTGTLAPYVPPPIDWGGDRGIFMGGWDNDGGDATTDRIDYISIPTGPEK